MHTVHIWHSVPHMPHSRAPAHAGELKGELWEERCQGNETTGSIKGRSAARESDRRSRIFRPMLAGSGFSSRAGTRRRCSCCRSRSAGGATGRMARTTSPPPHQSRGGVLRASALSCQSTPLPLPPRSCFLMLPPVSRRPASFAGQFPKRERDENGNGELQLRRRKIL